MPQPDIEEQEEPLDPAMERIRRKMVLLQLVSGGILFVCFMAVLAAVVYKVAQRPDAPAPVASTGGFSVPAGQPLAATAELPAGFQIQSVSLSGSQILFYGLLDGDQKAFVFDLAAGRIVADVTVGIPR
ncbi:hypothetical protein QTA58_16040 [Neorhizobium sp. CSC1952]|uniref:Fimbrial protein n=1 Tax=Xaviernesmea oryzae TaxID=464029 RepID=A0A1X7CUF8_9HYPH|nr:MULTISPECIES: hypothetical protein [Rhizobium/Agrobacterium group]WJR65733.1 hypothetical protein QTA58_16040 [Rhizobium sp. CSC1952]SMF03385.1 hypothetical protein SAMN02982989_4613 [Xaviernesmea oryzae]